jgi:hypothetical protein
MEKIISFKTHKTLYITKFFTLISVTERQLMAELLDIQNYQPLEHSHLQKPSEPPEINMPLQNQPLGPRESSVDAAEMLDSKADLTENKERLHDDYYQSGIQSEASRCSLKRKSHDQLRHQTKRTSWLAAAVWTTTTTNLRQNLGAANALAQKVLHLS